MNIISNNITDNIKPSITLLIDAKANAMKAQGHKIISLAVGEPDFDTPENIKLAAINAIKQGFTKYMPSGGKKELKEAIIEKFKRENDINYNIDEICVSSGVKQVIYNAFMASINPGDEVIILAPFWVSYPEIVKIAYGKPIIVNSKLNHNFDLDIAAIEQAIAPKTKWLIINSPNNPSGSVYCYEALRNLADMLLKHQNVHVLSDDIYEHLYYSDEKFYTLAQVAPELKNRILTVNGVSKAYAMTGWRIGYGAGPAELINAMGVVQSQSTSGACSISQMAAIEALNGPQDFIAQRNHILLNRRNIMIEQINQIFGLKCLEPMGAFYLFIDCAELFGKTTPNGTVIKDSNDVATYFIEQARVAVVAGSAFGIEGFFRISYATSSENLIEACKRIKLACDKLQIKR
jgi:aspartate aminotransferase